MQLRALLAPSPVLNTCTSLLLRKHHAGQQLPNRGSAYKRGQCLKKGWIMQWKTPPLPPASTLSKRVTRDEGLQPAPAEGLDEALKHLLAQVAPHILLHALLILCGNKMYVTGPQPRERLSRRLPRCFAHTAAGCRNDSIWACTSTALIARPTQQR